MVNNGASRGCITCKKRRVKCDETKPTCKECSRVGRECAGYGKQALRVRFRDETSRYQNASRDNSPASDDATMKQPTKPVSRQPHRRSRTHQDISVVASPQPNQQDFAVAFFLTYVTDIGRNLESTRGFLEFVRPVLSAEPESSALSTALNATAAKLWALLRPSSFSANQPIQLQNKALVRLQQAINSPVEQDQGATVLAALMLQQYDTMASVFDHHTALNTHREGALALLQKGRRMKKFKYHGHMLANVFHSKISYCIRHKVALSSADVKWLQNDVIPDLPSNPSSFLDVIGISISRLQSALFNPLRTQGADTPLPELQQLATLIRNVNAQLRTWLEKVPESWHPMTIHGDDAISPTITTYQDTYDVYPTIQVANIWNTWRIYRIIVEYAKMEMDLVPLGAYSGDDPVPPADETGDKRLLEIQTLIGGICQSVPFYLGNCSKPVSFHDLDDPALVFPSFHDLPPTNDAFLKYKRSGHYASKIDHHRHVALFGRLHALSILSSLHGLLFEEGDSILAQAVSLYQSEWIEEQFQRSLRLMRFDYHSIDASVSKRSDTPPGEPYQAPPTPTVAQMIRQALRTVTIL